MSAENSVVNARGVLTAEQVTVNGLTFTKGSTPEQRLAAIMEKQAAPNTVGGKAPPPTPKQLEAANKPLGDPSPERQAELDTELQAKGLMRRPDGTTHADGQPDLEAADRLTARYRQLRETLTSDKAQRELRETFERDMRKLLEGRPLSELELRIDAPKKPKESAPAPTVPAYSDDWKQHVEDGEWVNLDKLTTAHTSGYTLPRYVADQRLHVSAFNLLRQARAASMTQEQLNVVFKQQAVDNGWAKA